MEGTHVTITTEEYKKLLEASVRVRIFADFVNGSKYRIDREDCGKFLGFTVTEHEE